MTFWSTKPQAHQPQTLAHIWKACLRAARYPAQEVSQTFVCDTGRSKRFLRSLSI